MFYLSEVIGKRICDRQGNRIARISDVIVTLPEVEPPDSDTNASSDVADTDSTDSGEEGATPEQNVPVIKGLLARSGRRRPPFFLSIQQIESLGVDGARASSAKVDLQPFERRENEMLLGRDLWDKQVIDLESHRVLRVNDVVLTGAPLLDSDGGPCWWVRGVDIGMGGLLRRLHINKLAQSVTRKAVSPRIVRWKNLEVFGTNVPGGVRLQHKKLARLHPVEIARITDAVSYHQGAEIIGSLDDTLAADTLEEIAAERQTDIMEAISEERAADILDEMSPDDATDLLSELSEEKAGALLEQMDEEEAQEVRQLMRYPEDSAGGIMTTDFVRVFPTMTVGEVIETNRDIFSSADLIYYMYVIESEDEQKLIGVITVRDLLVQPSKAVVEEFMLTGYISVRPGEREGEVARKMAEYNLLALPVVDRAGVLLGVVTVDDALSAILPDGWKKRLPKIFS